MRGDILMKIKNHPYFKRHVLFDSWVPKRSLTSQNIVNFTKDVPHDGELPEPDGKSSSGSRRDIYLNSLRRILTGDWQERVQAIRRTTEMVEIGGLKNQGKSEEGWTNQRGDLMINDLVRGTRIGVQEDILATKSFLQEYSFFLSEGMNEQYKIKAAAWIRTKKRIAPTVSVVCRFESSLFTWNFSFFIYYIFYANYFHVMLVICMLSAWFVAFPACFCFSNNIPSVFEIITLLFEYTMMSHLRHARVNNMGHYIRNVNDTNYMKLHSDMNKII